MEIAQEDINFIRYADDYEVFIYDEQDLQKTQSTIAKILSKYSLFINGEKTKYIKFPFYNIENLSDIYNQYLNGTVKSIELNKLFNTFFNLEQNGIKGAIKFLTKSIDDRIQIENNELYFSYLLNILVNDSRSLTKVCELMIHQKNNLSYSDDDIEIIQKLLLKHIYHKNDLESIWLLILLKHLEVYSLNESVVDKIIESSNDLLIIVLLNEYSNCLNETQKNNCYNHAHSWILLYQLFLTDCITKDDFKNKTKITNNLPFYCLLKRNNFSFYKKIQLMD